MDKQKLRSPINTEGAQIISTSENITCPSVVTNCKPIETCSTEDLKMQILNSLPEMIIHQKNCQLSGADISCKLNAKLLQYFLQKEFMDNKQESTSVVPNNLAVASSQQVNETCADKICHQINQDACQENCCGDHQEVA